MDDGDATRTRVEKTVVHHADGPPEVAGYAIVRMIGRGGMGVVWHAIELRLDREVALKVHAEKSSGVLSMWNEARMAARVSDPGVVTVIDVGTTFDGRPYYTMEYIEGTSLNVLLREGALEAREALRIGADVTRAVAAAHQRGVIHCDLKPHNVMIDQSRRARILDFGLARAVSADRSSVVAGSPPYMPPEQIRGEAMGPPADVYAIGVILYEMLTGRRPFSASNDEELFDRICTTPPPPPSTLVSVPADVERIVLRCLAKEPAERFPTARALLEEIEAVREGRASSVSGGAEVDPPRRAASRRTNKPTRAEAHRTFVWSWTLKASPAALWPHVADTDRFNEAVGLGVVDVAQGREASDTVARRGSARAKGLRMSWREYPFEWIHEREHAVFRWYQHGPLEALWNRVVLGPRADGGTDLVHEIALTPRGVLGRVAVAVEIGQRLRRAIDRVYRHIDDIVCAGGDVDPYDSAHDPRSSEVACVEAGCRGLREAGFAQDAVDRFARMLLHAPARKLTRIRPLAMAPVLGLARDAALPFMLQAAHLGLLELAWDVICPTCRVAHESAHQLATVKGNARCEACETEYARDLVGSVELVFRAHPDVRQTKIEMFCAGSPARRPHVLVQLVLEPGEQRELAFELPRGEYTVGALGVEPLADLAISSVGHRAAGDVIVKETSLAVSPSVLREGRVTLKFANETSDERPVRIESRGARADGVPAIVAVTSPTFRDYFGRELIGEGEVIDVSHLFFLAVDASDRGALFSERGDAPACASLRDLEARFADLVRDARGAVLVGPLDTLVAAIPSGVRALHAGIEVIRSTDLPVRVALHGGKCLALTRESRIDYFGETLHRALWLATAAEPREAILSHAVAGDRDIAVALAAEDIEARVVEATAGPYGGRRVVRVRHRAR